MATECGKYQVVKKINLLKYIFPVKNELGSILNGTLKSVNREKVFQP